MAKKIPGATQSAASERIQRTEAYAGTVKRMFDETVNDILKLKLAKPTEEGVMYSFDGDSLQVRKQVEYYLKRLHASATLAVKKGIQAEWGIANREMDNLVKATFGKKLFESDRFRAWTAHNEDAMNAFVNRTDKGMNLSDRVWKASRQLRDEMEVALTVGMGSGESAASMSRAVRQCLNDPDLMFRRFRYKKGEDADGNPVYGRKWKKKVIVDGKTKWIDYDKDSYIPKGAGEHSRGVYRSAAKNAMRVARTETNMAYRRADYERWQKMDFVLGIRIEMSNQHPRPDICDEMQGDYPKTFYFSGFHPFCFCYATPILVSEDEMAKVTEEFMEGRTYVPKGEPILDTPPAFKQWVSDNSDRIRNASSLPYWIKDNPQFVDARKGVALTPDPKTIKAEIAKEGLAATVKPQRTKEEAERIQKRWDESRKVAREVDKILAEMPVKEGWRGILDAEIDACNDVASLSRLMVDKGVASSVSISTMALPEAQQVCKAIADVSARFGLDPFAIQTKNIRKAMMEAHGKEMLINNAYFSKKNAAIALPRSYKNDVTDYVSNKEKRIAIYKDWIDKWKEALQKETNPYSIKWYKKEIKKHEKIIDATQSLLDNGYKRFGIRLSKDTVARDCTTHECGHVVHDQLLGGINPRFRQSRIDPNTANKMNLEMKDLYRKYKGKASFLSEYGDTDWQEFVAESMVLYTYQAEKLPKDVLDWFTRLEALGAKRKFAMQKPTRAEAYEEYKRRHSQKTNDVKKAQSKAVKTEKKPKDPVLTHIKEYAQTYIDKYEGETISGGNFASGSLTVLRRSLEDVYSHCKKNPTILEWLASFSKDSIKDWEHIGWLECQPYPSSHKNFNPDQPDVKKHQEAEYFNYYKLKIKGKTFYASVKVHRMQKREVLYSITETLEYEYHPGKKR